MKALSLNEIESSLTLLKEPLADYNANSLGKKQGISAMGALKILKRLEKQNLLKSRKLGKAVFYKPNLADDYSRRFFELLLEKQAEESDPRIKKWIRELRKLSGKAQAAILFGSVLEKQDHGDVDVLIILEPTQNDIVEKAIEELNQLNVKKIHAVKQTKEDMVQNIRKGDRIVLEAIGKGIVPFGYGKIVEAIKDATRRQ